MKILLVLPAGENYRVTPERPCVPPRAMLRFSVLPLTTVAALTPAQHEVRIVDENVEPLDFETDCDLVGVSFMTALAPRAYAIACEFRKRGKIVVAGGYHATLCAAETLRHFDAVVVGDAEDTWPQVLRDIEAGRLQQVYRSAGGAMTTPIPRRDLLMRTARHYATVNAVQAGRGCRHACRYCSVTAFHRQTYRHRTVSDVLAQLQTVSGNFLFVDDNIIADRDWSRYDYRHVVFQPARMSAAQLQAGADWMYAQFYRLDRIFWRFVRGLFTVGWLPALLALKLGLTYRYDNQREGIVGWNPACQNNIATQNGNLYNWQEATT